LDGGALVSASAKAEPKKDPFCTKCGRGTSPIPVLIDDLRAALNGQPGEGPVQRAVQCLDSRVMLIQLLPEEIEDAAELANEIAQSIDVAEDVARARILVRVLSDIARDLRGMVGEREAMEMA
jgi:hypothetical protein